MIKKKLYCGCFDRYCVCHMGYDFSRNGDFCISFSLKKYLNIDVIFVRIYTKQACSLTYGEHNLYEHLCNTTMLYLKWYVVLP